MIPRFLLRGVAAMHVPEKVRRSVVFLGSKNEHGVFIPRATAFLVQSHSKGDDHVFPHLVTAEHVVSGMQAKGLEIFVRINLKKDVAEAAGEDASVVSMEGHSDWYFHPDTSQQSDVAVATVGINLDFADHDYMPIFEYAWSELDSSFAPRQPRLGDEVFIVGLFRSHYGRQRNRPIIRIGNIAALPEEPVFTKYAGYVDAYLIEARSISGLSGSPVFANVDAQPSFQFIPDPRFQPDPESVNWPRYHFLGLMHGHFDLENLTEDSVVDDASQSRGINSGIGVVIPASKILETLYQPELKAMRKKGIERARKLKGATGDVDLSDSSERRGPAANDDNPKHREDFTSLVSAAARKRAQED
jgi:hypothetical protein